MAATIQSSTWVVMHVSHTDVRVDARILKEVASLQEIGTLHQVVVGIDRPKGAAFGKTDLSVDVVVLRLMGRKLRRSGWLPGIIRSALGLSEATIRMFSLVLRHRPRVVHCHDVVFLHVGALAKLFIGARVVYDAHELESASKSCSRALSLCVYCVERVLWPFVDRLVSVSPSIIDWYQQHLGPKPSLLVLNSPVTGSAQSRPSDLVRRERGSPGYFHAHFDMPSRSKVFVYLGLLVPGRGIERLLEVFGRADARSHIVFMGYGDRLGAGDAAQRCSNIHLHPAVPHEQVVEYVRHADCGVCLIEDVSLSDRLCLPNKLFEYAFAGLPVLASRLPEIERVVREYGLGVCCDNDVDSIRQVVEAIERDGISPSTADLTELSWERQAERLREAYRQLLDRQNGTTRNQPKAGER
jgi:glycosyltransferase involved in cell wall biosynthesis